MENNQEDNNRLSNLVKETVHSAKYIKAVNLSTEDGFTLFSCAVNGYSVEKDKLSAVSSSLLSLSNAATNQLMQSQLSNTVIEANDGIMVTVKTKYKGKLAVLCVIAEMRLNVGKARYYSVKLAQEIFKLLGE